jgi:mannose-6-phosphate isomerase-like protein (cupin superfamily)
LLAPAFDARALLAEASALAPDAWLPYVDTDDCEGDVSGVALRSPGARLSLDPDPNAMEPYADTAHLARCPRVRAALERLQTEISSARFLRLGAGARIREQREDRIGFERGEVRLHVALETSDDVVFAVAGRAWPMRAGECWYVDVTQPHGVHNPGSTPRIDLVVDVAVNAWLRAQLEEAATRAFQRFALRVAADEGLQAELQPIEARDEFARRAAAAGARHGFAFTPDDVAAAMAATFARQFDGINR